MTAFPTPSSRPLRRAAIAAALGLLASFAHAQPARIAPAAPRAAPAAGMGMPSAGGLASPAAAAGLRSPNPAGLTAGAGVSGMANVTGGTSTPVLDSVATDGTAYDPASAMGGPGGPAARNANTYNATGVMGGPGVPAAAQGVPAGPGPWSAVDMARSFIGADANRDGDLTRAEATRLSILPIPFEEIDRNKDGILSRSEYEDSLR